MQRTQRAFAKNVKERKERNVLLVRTKKTQKGKVLLQKNAKEHITLHSFEIFRLNHVQIAARRMSIRSTSSEDSGTAVDVDQVFYNLFS